MLVCSLCKKTVASTLKDLHKHFKVYHALFERYDRYTCIQNGCHSAFGDKYTFRYHMISYHNNCIDNINQSNGEYAGGTEYMSVCGETGSGAECMQSEDVKLAMNVKELACKFICQCKK